MCSFIVAYTNFLPACVNIQNKGYSVVVCREWHGSIVIFQSARMRDGRGSLSGVKGPADGDLGNESRVTQQDLITTVQTTQYGLVVQYVFRVQLIVTRRLASRRRCRWRRVDGPQENTVDDSRVRGRRDSFLSAKDRQRGWYAGGMALSLCRRGWRCDGSSSCWPLTLDARHPLLPSWSTCWPPPTCAASVRCWLLLLLNTAVIISIVTWRRLAIAGINHVHSVCKMKSWPRGTLAWRAAVRHRTNVVDVTLHHSRRHRATFYVNTLERRPTGTRLGVRTRLQNTLNRSKIDKLSK